MVDKKTHTTQAALNQDADASRNEQPAPGELRDHPNRGQDLTTAPNGEVRLEPPKNPDPNAPNQTNQNQDPKRLVSIDKSRVNSEIDAWVSYAQTTELKDGQEHVLKITAGLDGDLHVDRSILQKPV